MKVKIKQGRKTREYEIVVPEDKKLPEEAGNWLPEGLTYTDLMGQPRFLDGLKKNIGRFFSQEYLHGLKSRFWKRRDIKKSRNCSSILPASRIYS